MLPSLIVAAFAHKYPLAFAIIPAEESSECLCQYQMESYFSLFSLVTLNTLMFFSFNWIFILNNIVMAYRIRFISDKLSIRTEMVYFVGTYTFFCYVQYSIYMVDLRSGCSLFTTPKFLQEYNHEFTYLTIVTRDLCLLIIMCFYLCRKSKRIKELRLQSEVGARETYV
jgi:hypothetical protein